MLVYLAYLFFIGIAAIQVFRRNSLSHVMLKRLKTKGGLRDYRELKKRRQQRQQ